MLNQNVGRPFLSSGAGEGAWRCGRDLSEVDDSLKFILFFFTVKNPGHRSPQVRYRLSPAISRWLSARFSGSRGHRWVSLLPSFLMTLQDTENQQVVTRRNSRENYHIFLAQVSKLTCPSSIILLCLLIYILLPLQVSSFADAPIFLF